jgi:hypothetical protein
MDCERPQPPVNTTGQPLLPGRVTTTSQHETNRIIHRNDMKRERERNDNMNKNRYIIKNKQKSYM